MKCARREKERERVRAVKRRTLATGCPGNEGAEKVKTGFGIHKSCVLPAHSHFFSIQNDLGASHFFFYVLLLLPFTIRNCFDSRYEVD